MEMVVDSAGRIMIPKSLRTALGLLPGATVDVSAYGSGLQITPGGRTAHLTRDHNGRLVAAGDGSLDDDTLFAMIDAGRR
jgi:AbrB family looped-hinge helix DNA binding protein